MNQAQTLKPLQATGVGRFGWLLWLLALALLPLTSLSWIPFDTPVRPPTPVLAGLAMALLLGAGFMDWRNFLAMRQVRALGLFVAWALFATAIGLLLDAHPPMKGYTGLSAAAKGVISLGMGVCVYLTAQIALMDHERRRQSELWLIAGMSACVLLALVQALAGLGVAWASQLSLWVADHLTVQYGAKQYLAEGRAWGLSLEPSFMASALAVILLPIGLTRALIDGSRMGWYAAALGYVGIGLSTSRGGLLAAVVVTGISLVWLSMPAARHLGRRRRLLAGLALAVLLGIGLGLGARSRVTSCVVHLPPLLNEAAHPSAPQPARPAAVASSTTVGYLGPAAQQTVRPAWVDHFGEIGMLYRALCGIAAMETFLDHPVAGTGLGLSGWELRQRFPAWARADVGITEIAADLDESNPRLPNAKNLPLRLLAELGSIGFALFALFIWLHRPGRITGRPEAVLLPLLVFGALAVDWLTIDSFALVAPWLALAWAANAREQYGDVEAR